MLLKWWFVYWLSRKHCGKRRKCWLPAFSSFSTMFLKGKSSNPSLCEEDFMLSFQRQISWLSHIDFVSRPVPSIWRKPKLFFLLHTQDCWVDTCDCWMSMLSQESFSSNLKNAPYTGEINHSIVIPVSHKKLYLNLVLIPAAVLD